VSLTEIPLWAEEAGQIRTISSNADAHSVGQERTVSRVGSAGCFISAPVVGPLLRCWVVAIGPAAPVQPQEPVWRCAAVVRPPVPRCAARCERSALFEKNPEKSAETRYGRCRACGLLRRAGQPHCWRRPGGALAFALLWFGGGFRPQDRQTGQRTERRILPAPCVLASGWSRGPGALSSGPAARHKHELGCCRGLEQLEQRPHKLPGQSPAVPPRRSPDLFCSTLRRRLRRPTRGRPAAARPRPAPPGLWRATASLGRAATQGFGWQSRAGRRWLRANRRNDRTGLHATNIGGATRRPAPTPRRAAAPPETKRRQRTAGDRRGAKRSTQKEQQRKQRVRTDSLREKNNRRALRRPVAGVAWAGLLAPPVLE